MFHGDASHGEGIRNQRAVAAPRHHFGTHYDGPLSPRPTEEFLQALLEPGCQHVIGISLEGRILPARIRRIRLTAAQARQARQMYIADTDLTESFRQGILVELWVTPGARHLPHIRHQGYVVSAQKAQEIFQQPVRVPNRKYHWECGGGAIPHLSATSAMQPVADASW
jgi:hypothetical protein